MKARPIVVINTALSAIVVSLMIAGAIGIYQKIVDVQATIDERVAEGTRVWGKIEQYIESNGHPPDTLQELHRLFPLTDGQIPLRYGFG